MAAPIELPDTYGPGDRRRKLLALLDAAGERERAFYCYAMLLQIGKQSGAFENLAEGYINCIRVLKEDNLKFYVLHYYEDFLQAALEREEFHAAAVALREAADYAGGRLEIGA